MGLIVVDASVAAKWALDEADSPAALALLRGGDLLIAPDLLIVEVAGAITRAVHNGRLTAGRAGEALASWLEGVQRGAVELVPNVRDVRRAAEISSSLPHKLPDCLYLALAERLGCELLSADTTFVRKAPAIYPRIRLFGSAGSAGSIGGAGRSPGA